MQFFRPALFLFSSLALVALNPAQQPQRNPQAVAILTSALAGMGGSQLASASREQMTMVASGTYTQFGAPMPPSYPVRFKLLGLDQVRWETDRPEGTVVTIIRGDSGWSVTPAGIQRLPVGALFGRKVEGMPLLALLDWLTSPGARFRYAGLETIEGRNLHHLVLNRRPGGQAISDLDSPYEQMSQCELFIDSQGFRLVRLRYYEHPGDWRVNIPIDLVFSNYQRVGGLLMPSTVTRYLRGQRMDEYQFHSIHLGASVDRSDFAVR